MRFFALTAFVAAVAILLVSAPAASATPSAAVARGYGTTYSQADHYGAPIPPWKKGCKPGWYYGNNPAHVKQFGFELIYLKASVGLISSLPLYPSILYPTVLISMTLITVHIVHLSPPQSLALQLPQVPQGPASAPPPPPLHTHTHTHQDFDDPY